MKNYYGYAGSIDKDDARQPLWKQQREEQGWDETELWNLDQTIAAFILPRLKAFRKHSYSHPYGMSEADWTRALDQMIEYFEGVVLDLNTKNRVGLELFCKHFENLWE